MRSYITPESPPATKPAIDMINKNLEAKMARFQSLLSELAAKGKAGDLSDVRGVEEAEALLDEVHDAMVLRWGISEDKGSVKVLTAFNEAYTGLFMVKEAQMRFLAIDSKRSVVSRLIYALLPHDFLLNIYEPELCDRIARRTEFCQQQRVPVIYAIVSERERFWLAIHSFCHGALGLITKALSFAWR